MILEIENKEDVMQGCKKLIFSVLMFGSILIQGCIPAHQEYIYNQGVMYYSYQQYTRAFIMLAPLARQGNPDAQYAIAYLYYYGLGVVEDQMVAEYWLNKASMQGQPLAIIAIQCIDKNRALTLKKPLHIVTIY